VKIFSHPNQQLYQPQYEFSGSGMRKYPESITRIQLIIDELQKSTKLDQLKIVEPSICDVGLIKSVHNEDYVEFLQSIPPDIDELAPTVFAFPNPKIHPKETFQAKLGYYLFDPATPITPQVYTSAVASVSSAVSCANDLLKQNLSIALCRPPGHHSGYSHGGGYCFFNNAVIAANVLRKQGKSVAILDLDYHHGNGTQELTYQTSEVFFVSIHAEHAYPFYWGSIDEIGTGNGRGFNVNIPISATADEETYSNALKKAIKHLDDFDADVLLLSMGFDCYFKDTIAGMGLSLEYYQKIGQELSKYEKIGILLEGGYHQDIGKCFVQLLSGMEL
jgi:acetoin utilization deacetylase AcuC-like enzyme